jgi:V/A-type H+/Na+-transporting ATPase subunit D
MADLHGLPPGRAGRLWLRRRLTTAQRGAELLDRKLRILRGERERLRDVVERTGAQWATTYATANTWLVRVALLGGQRQIRLATEETFASTTLTWQTVMGVCYPDGATVTAAQPVGSGAGGSALIQARSAHTVALVAAVEHAAAVRALDAVQAEIDATFHRSRAINDHWIPRLQRAQSQLAQKLEEIERDETVRLRWAARRT